MVCSCGGVFISVVFVAVVAVLGIERQTAGNNLVVGV
jgi:hypothetical protein